MNAVLHPARAVALGFLAAILAGTVLLLLPAARAGDGAASFVAAFFTAVSAVCVTGLAVVDTGTCRMFSRRWEGESASSWRTE